MRVGGWVGVGEREGDGGLKISLLQRRRFVTIIIVKKWTLFAFQRAVSFFIRINF